MSLQRLKQFFAGIAAADEQVEDAHAVAMAAAMLLLEVAWADHQVTQAEIQSVKRAVSQLFQLPADTIDALVARAAQDHKDETSVYPFTRAINDNLSAEERVQLVVELWRLALSDELLDKYEEFQICRIAELLYVPHADFINAKFKARRGGSWSLTNHSLR